MGNTTRHCFLAHGPTSPRQRVGNYSRSRSIPLGFTPSRSCFPEEPSSGPLPRMRLRVCPWSIKTQQSGRYPRRRHEQYRVLFPPDNWPSLSTTSTSMPTRSGRRSRQKARWIAGSCSGRTPRGRGFMKVMNVEPAAENRFDVLDPGPEQRTGGGRWDHRNRHWCGSRPGCRFPA
jgi:hypothetical protein